VRSVLLLVLGVICSRFAATQDLNDADQICHLKIIAIDSFGKAVANPKVAIEELMNGKVVRAFDVGPEPPPLHYGTFRIIVSSSGLYSPSKTVVLNATYQTVVLVLTQVHIEARPILRPVLGLLKVSASEGNCSWIELISPFVPERVFESRVYKGSFGFDYVPPGRYIAIVLGSGGLCGMSQVDVLLDQTDILVEMGMSLN
jgi:hypothetical protein